jgi:hypothetical protein
LDKDHKEGQLMTEPIVALQDYLRNVGVDMDSDFLRDGIALLTRLLRDVEVSQQIGPASTRPTLWNG